MLWRAGILEGRALGIRQVVVCMLLIAGKSGNEPIRLAATNTDVMYLEVSCSRFQSTISG